MNNFIDFASINPVSTIFTFTTFAYGISSILKAAKSGNKLGSWLIVISLIVFCAFCILGLPQITDFVDKNAFYYFIILLIFDALFLSLVNGTIFSWGKVLDSDKND